MSLHLIGLQLGYYKGVVNTAQQPKRAAIKTFFFLKRGNKKNILSKKFSWERENSFCPFSLFFFPSSLYILVIGVIQEISCIYTLHTRPGTSLIRAKEKPAACSAASTCRNSYVTFERLRAANDDLPRYYTALSTVSSYYDPRSDLYRLSFAYQIWIGTEYTCITFLCRFQFVQL